MDTTAEATIIPVYQYHMDLTDGNGTLYFYSTEEDFGQGWILDKAVWYGSSSPFPGMSPVYQFSQTLPDGTTTQYFFSMESNAPPGWQFDQLGWYAIDINQWTESSYVYQYVKPLENDGGYQYLYTTNTDYGGGWKKVGGVFAGPSITFNAQGGTVTSDPTQSCWEFTPSGGLPIYIRQQVTDITIPVGDSVAIISIPAKQRDCPGPGNNLLSIVILDKANQS